MKQLSFTALLLFINGLSYGQAIANYAMSNAGNNTVLISSVFSSNGSGPLTQDLSTITLFIPNGLVNPVITSLQGGNWMTSVIISNQDLSIACGPAADNYYLVQISTNGQASLGSVVAGVPESLFTVSFTGSSGLPVNAYDPNEADPLSACVGPIGVDNTASIDPDGNAGPAPAVGYSDIPVIPSGIVLPIELTQFAARPLNTTDALLNWETSSEINSSHFEIERSLDGQAWKYVGKELAAGQSQAALDYAFVDEKVHAPDGPHNLYYYRLKMVDLDGSHEYSKVVSVEMGTRQAISLYPNPASASVTIGLPPSHETSLLKIENSLGTRMMLVEVAPDTRHHTIDISGLPAGFYFISTEAGLPVQFVKQ